MSARVQGWVWDLDIPAQPKLLLLWLANRATDAGVCFPTKRELGKRTGLSERMVRYHLEWLARKRADQGEPRAPLLSIIERRVAADRNTSNVYVICVPWAEPELVRAELNELKHVPGRALQEVGATSCTQEGGDHGLHPLGATGAPQVGDTGCTQNRSPDDDHRQSPPIPPAVKRQRQQGNGLSSEAGVPPQTTMAPLQIPDDQPRALLDAFYAALGADIESVTHSMQPPSRSCNHERKRGIPWLQPWGGGQSAGCVHRQRLTACSYVCSSRATPTSRCRWTRSASAGRATGRPEAWTSCSRSRSTRPSCTARAGGAL
jgi:hypothetical protein